MYRYRYFLSCGHIYEELLTAHLLDRVGWEVICLRCCEIARVESVLIEREPTLVYEVDDLGNVTIAELR